MPVLHGHHWMAIMGKPLRGTAGAMVFQKGGNAVDAACAMITATTTMWAAQATTAKITISTGNRA